jgi:hypothetical protein
MLLALARWRGLDVTDQENADTDAVLAGSESLSHDSPQA